MYELYHGSDRVIEFPEYCGSCEINDYGYGFYMTSDIDSALESACRNGNNGVVNRYVVTVPTNKILMLNQKSVMTWLSVLLRNRVIDFKAEQTFDIYKYIIENYSINTEDYYLIKGYRADDVYFKFVRRFLDNNMCIENLTKAMQSGTLSLQYVLKKRSAFDSRYIKYRGSISVDAETLYKKAQDRRKFIDTECDRLSGYEPTGHYLYDMIRNKQIELFHDM